MGKKTVKVPYTDKIEKSSMFSQSQEDLLKIYPLDALQGLYGCVLRPLEHSDGGYFFYRKDLGNGEMLVCGECYPKDNAEVYQEDIYWVDDDHEPNTCFFIEEDSLVDDDTFNEEDFYIAVEKEKKEKKLQQELQKLNISSEAATKGPRVYIVNVSKCNMIGRATSDEAFMTEAEKQGTVYTLSGFEEAFNYDDISSDSCLMRII